MRSWLRAAVLLPLVLAMLALVPLRLAAASDSELVTARLGIAAGAAEDDLPLGTSGSALAMQIPILNEEASSLGVRVDTVSVGQGFWSDNGELQAEQDLDLVVTGPRDSVNALAALLGKSWDQSAVYVWYAAADGPMATATIPLPGGTDGLTTSVYQQLVVELTDGGHVRYAGPDSLIFVAHTGDDSEDAFAARMGRVQQILQNAGVATGPLQAGRAEMVVLDQDNYDQYIAPRVHGKAA